MARRRRQRRRFGNLVEARSDLGYARNAVKAGKCSAALGFYGAAAYELGEANEGKGKAYRDLEEVADLIVKRCMVRRS